MHHTSLCTAYNEKRHTQQKIEAYLSLGYSLGCASVICGSISFIVCSFPFYISVGIEENYLVLCFIIKDYLVCDS